MYISSTTNVSTTASSIWDSLIKATTQSNSASIASKKDSSSNKAVMRDLIDKVSGDTASETEIQELAAKLKEMATQKDKRAENMSSSSGTSSDTEMDSLMGKIKNGTATSDEIKSIATKMKERATDMQAHFAGMGSPVPPNGGFNDEMKELIDKAVAGTASDSEIKDLTDKLKKNVAKMQSLTSQTTSTDDTSSASNMESLLEKVKNGTATDADIKAIATQIKEHGPAKPPGGKPPEGIPPTDGASSIIRSKSVALDELLQLLSKLSIEDTEESADTTSGSSSNEKNKYSITASNQLMDSFMEAYSQDYNGVVTTTQKVIG